MKLTVKDIDLKNKKVIVRCDFNVPQDANLKITDDARIRASLPTIKYILEQSPKKLILMSHLGRPDGKVTEKYSLKPVAARLKELLAGPVKMLTDCVGENIKSEINSAEEKIILLENLRFHAEEEKNDPVFSKNLADLAEIFINDAFGSAHRAHGSTEGIARYLPSAAGFLLEKEIKYLGGALQNPLKPLVVILGGAKVSDKIILIDNLLNKAGTIIVGGGMCYTFLKAQGVEIGNSKLEKDKIEVAKNILTKAKKLNVKILLPVDNIIADRIALDANVQTSGESIPEGWFGVDIGPKTIELFAQELKTAKTILWNGPLGIFEIAPFSNGTRKIMELIAGLKTISIIGGGDTAAAASAFGQEEKMTHVSTGGGASLEFLEGKILPGVAALTEKK